MRHWLKLMFAGLGVIFLVNCKTSKNVIEVKDVVTPLNVFPNDVPIHVNQFDWFDGKFNGDINNDGKTNAIKGRVKIRKDSVIWIQIKPDVAIIEAFRVLITPDSVRFIDYLNKKYFKDQFDAIKSFIQFDVSFEMVEGIFTGNYSLILPLGDYMVYENKSKETILSSSDFPTYVDARKSGVSANYLFQAIWVEDSTYKRNLVYDPANRLELDIQYKSFQSLENMNFPKEGELTIIGDSTNTRFGFDYTKTKLNQSTSFPFSIPSSYQQIFLSE